MEALSTQLSAERFAQFFNRVLAATVTNNADALLWRAKMEVYFEALRSRPEWAISQAVTRLIERERFFPPVARWVEESDRAIEDRLREALNAHREWKLHCETCRDTGWKPHLCAPGQRCGREFCKKHDEAQIPYEHEYLSPCACRETNPSYLRDRDYTRAQATLRGGKRD